MLILHSMWAVLHVCLQVSHFLAAPCTSSSLAPLDLTSAAAVHEAFLQLRQLYQQHTQAPGAPLAAHIASHRESQALNLRAAAAAAQQQHDGKTCKTSEGKAGGKAAGTEQISSLVPCQQQLPQQQKQQTHHILLPPPPSPPLQQQPWEGAGVGEVEDEASSHQAGGVGVAPEPSPVPLQGAGLNPSGLHHLQQNSLRGSNGSCAMPGDPESLRGAQHRGLGSLNMDACSTSSDGRRGGKELKGVHGGSSMSRETAAEEYKQGPGAAKADLLLENRARLKELKRRAKVG